MYLFQEREETIRGFKAGTLAYLVASDVAARGLDFPKLHYVLCYDLPRTMCEYIHRIGRTGRMRRQGTAISFFNRFLARWLPVSSW